MLKDLARSKARHLFNKQRRFKIPQGTYCHQFNSSRLCWSSQTRPASQAATQLHNVTCHLGHNGNPNFINWCLRHARLRIRGEPLFQVHWAPIVMCWLLLVFVDSEGPSRVHSRRVCLAHFRLCWTQHLLSQGPWFPLEINNHRTLFLHSEC